MLFIYSNFKTEINAKSSKDERTIDQNTVYILGVWAMMIPNVKIRNNCHYIVMINSSNGINIYIIMYVLSLNIWWHQYIGGCC